MKKLLGFEVSYCNLFANNSVFYHFLEKTNKTDLNHCVKKYRRMRIL